MMQLQTRKGATATGGFGEVERHQAVETGIKKIDSRSSVDATR
jgi:hypothetical protein